MDNAVVLKALEQRAEQMQEELLINVIPAFIGTPHCAKLIDRLRREAAVRLPISSVGQPHALEIGHF